MKPSFLGLSGVVLWACLTFSPIAAKASLLKHPKLKSTESKITPGRYIIEFSKDGSRQDQVMVQSIEETFSETVKVTNNFNHKLFNAATVDLRYTNPEVMKHILELPNVKAVYHIEKYSLDDTWTESASLQKRRSENSINMPQVVAQVDRVRSELGYKGKGVFIGIIDSGIDYLHPALGGGFGKGFKIAAGYDLVGDYAKPDGTYVPDEDPYVNCTNGSRNALGTHATHIAGIIAGSSKEDDFYGVAPEATLGVWRVFTCRENTDTDLIVRAILMAYDAGVDIITMSITKNSNFSYESPITQVVKKVVAEGVHFVNSAGNDGFGGPFSVGDPAFNTNVLSVGAMSLGEYRIGFVNLSSDVSLKFPMFGAHARIPEDGELVLGDAGIDELAPGCDLEDIPDNVNGKIVIIPFGACKIGRKADMASQKGAIGLLVYGKKIEAGAVENGNTKIPTVILQALHGQTIVDLLKAGKKININFSSKNEPTTADFSSLGPNAGLDLTPRISAIGEFVNSTLPRENGYYGLMSGTSMSAPFVAGSIALYLNAIGKEKQSVKYVNEVIQNYARPYNSETFPMIDNPIRQSAGMIQVYDAITQGVHVSPSQISFNDTANSAYRTQKIKITNKGKDIIQFDIVNDVSLGLSITISEDDDVFALRGFEEVSAPAKLKFSKNSMKLSPGASQEIKITVTPPTGDKNNHIFYGGYVHFRSKQKDKNVDVRVPYIGVNNDMRKLPGFKYY